MLYTARGLNTSMLGVSWGQAPAQCIPVPSVDRSSRCSVVYSVASPLGTQLEHSPLHRLLFPCYLPHRSASVASRFQGTSAALVKPSRRGVKLGRHGVDGSVASRP